jgi:hypothetical protein
MILCLSCAAAATTADVITAAAVVATTATTAIATTAAAAAQRLHQGCCQVAHVWGSGSPAGGILQDRTHHCTCFLRH